jgi:hypothetical protein
MLHIVPPNKERTKHNLSKLTVSPQKRTVENDSTDRVVSSHCIRSSCNTITPSSLEINPMTVLNIGVLIYVFPFLYPAIRTTLVQ